MAWYNFWNKNKQDIPTNVELPVIETVETPELSIADYPFEHYKVYWETHIYQQADGIFAGEVRFLSIPKSAQIEVHTVYADTEEQLNKLVVKLIREKMETFKV